MEKPQLSPLEFMLLAGSVLAAGAGPLILNGEVTELLAPSAAACKLSCHVDRSIVCLLCET